MDIANFVENFMGVELQDWQKNHIRTLYDKYQADGDIRIVFPRHSGRSHQMYVYMKTKELTPNGETNDYKHQMSSMWRSSRASSR